MPYQIASAPRNFALHRPKPRARRRGWHLGGFSLIELMVALTISLILIGGLSAVFINTHRSYRLQTDIQQLNENGRYAMELLARDIRMAGYYGCAKDPNPTDTAGAVRTGVEYAGGTDFASLPLHGYEHTDAAATWRPNALAIPDPAPNLATDSAGNVQDLNSDSLIVRMAVPFPSNLDPDRNNHTRLNEAMRSTTADLQINRVVPDEWDAGDLMLIGTCDQADIFQTTTSNTDPAMEHKTISLGGYQNASESFSRVYDTSARLYKFYSIRYEVRPDVNNNDLPTLYRQVNGAAAEAAIPGVENMQLLYGEDTGGTRAPDELRQANAVANWNAVRSVRISLLLRSEREYGNLDDRRANYPITVGDFNFVDDNLRVRRRVFETSVGIRNGF